MQWFTRSSSHAAVANGLALGTPLAEGRVIKVTIAEPYQPKQGR